MKKLLAVTLLTLTIAILAPSTTVSAGDVLWPTMEIEPITMEETFDLPEPISEEEYYRLKYAEDEPESGDVEENKGSEEDAREEEPANDLIQSDIEVELEKIESTDDSNNDSSDNERQHPCSGDGDCVAEPEVVCHIDIYWDEDWEEDEPVAAQTTSTASAPDTSSSPSGDSSSPKGAHKKTAPNYYFGKGISENSKQQAQKELKQLLKAGDLERDDLGLYEYDKDNTVIQISDGEQYLYQQISEDGVSYLHNGKELTLKDALDLLK